MKHNNLAYLTVGFQRPESILEQFQSALLKQELMSHNIHDEGCVHPENQSRFLNEYWNNFKVQSQSRNHCH